jgi:hypothetical protein
MTSSGAARVMISSLAAQATILLKVKLETTLSI